MEIAQGVYSMQERKGLFVHAFLLDDGDGLTLIDTLISLDAETILDELKRIGKSVTDIKRIVMTHAHRAHLGGIAKLQQASGASVYAHEWEADIISGDRQLQNTTLRPMKPYFLWPFQIGARIGKPAPSCEVNHFLQDGDKVGPLQVVRTPGHTPGHLAFYWREAKTMFAGDSIVTWPEFGPGWPFFMLNFKQNQISMQKMTEFDFEVLGVGHGDPILSSGAERLKELVKKLG